MSEKRTRSAAEEQLASAMGNLFGTASGVVYMCRGRAEDQFFNALQAVVDERVDARMEAVLGKLR